ncbi:hypothetical protein D3C72_936880 [compost metagenome]
MYQFFPVVYFGILAHPDWKFFGMRRTDYQQRIIDKRQRRRAELVIHFMLRTEEFSWNEFPIKHIGAMPIAPLVRRKQIIFSLEISDYRISCCSVFSLGYKIRNRAIAVIYIYRIAICFLLRKTFSKGKQQSSYRNGFECILQVSFF